MKRVLLLIGAVAALAGCGAEPPQHRPSWNSCYLGRGIAGGMLIYNHTAGSRQSSHPHRDSLAFWPASTFKIFNSLVALETGVVTADSMVIPWDSTEHWWDKHNRDHDLNTAFEYSVLWYYQEVARRIGRERMQQYLDMVGYGNADISGAVDSFWLNGGLRISNQQQIDFLVRLYENDLPFSQRSMDIVKDIMVRDSTDTYVLRYKTGWAVAGPNVGWLVGWVERPDSVWFFASHVVSDDHDAVGRARTDVPMRILRQEKIIP